MPPSPVFSAAWLAREVSSTWHVVLGREWFVRVQISRRVRCGGAGARNRSSQNSKLQRRRRTCTRCTSWPLLRKVLAAHVTVSAVGGRQKQRGGRCAGERRRLRPSGGGPHPAGWCHARVPQAARVVAGAARRPGAQGGHRRAAQPRSAPFQALRRDQQADQVLHSPPEMDESSTAITTRSDGPAAAAAEAALPMLERGEWMQDEIWSSEGRFAEIRGWPPSKALRRPHALQHQSVITCPPTREPSLPLVWSTTWYMFRRLSGCRHVPRCARLSSLEGPTSALDPAAKSAQRY